MMKSSRLRFSTYLILAVLGGSQALIAFSDGAEVPPAGFADHQTECPDFSGTYSDRNDREVYKREWVFVQDGCRSLTLYGRFFAAGKSYVSEPRTELLDGLWRKPCEHCLESLWGFKDVELRSALKGSEGRGCETRHAYTLDANRTRLSHEWGSFCASESNGTYQPEHSDAKESQPARAIEPIRLRFEYVSEIPVTPLGRLRWAKARAWNALVEISPSNSYLIPLYTVKASSLDATAAFDTAKAYECMTRAEPVMDDSDPRAYLVHELLDCSEH